MKLGLYIAVCTLALVPAIAFAQSVPQCDTPEQKVQCQKEYDALQQEIAQWQKVLDDTKAKKNTLQGDVTALDAQIKKAQAEIRQRNITIGKLSDQIVQKTAVVHTLEQRLDAGMESLAKLLRQKNEAEQQPLVVLALSSNNLSDFFSDVQNIDSIDQNLQALFAELRSTKEQTEKEKSALAKQKDAQVDARYEVQIKESQIKEDQNQKKDLLAITKNQEAQYSQVLAERQQRAQQIKNALFNLRDTTGISFESALNYATLASQKTGVRPAMILAILSQESDLGKNIGACLVASLETGDGVGKTSGTFYQKVMKAPRDTQPFESIMSALGLNWAIAPVSCPLGTTYTSSRGYGGAMGPSQFIPSTWQLFASRINKALGTSGTPNPYDPQTAIVATALYLSDLGAGLQTYSAERNAACKYYSGRACDTRRPTNYTYGDSVLKKAKTFQDNIDFLNNL